MGRIWNRRKRELDKALILTQNSLEIWKKEYASYKTLEKQKDSRAPQVSAQANLLHDDYQTARRVSDQMWRDLTNIADFDRARADARKQLWKRRWERLGAAFHYLISCRWWKRGQPSAVDAQFTLMGEDDDDEGEEMSENRQDE